MSCKICEKMLHTLFKAESSSDSLVFVNSTYQRLSAFFFPASAHHSGANLDETDMQSTDRLHCILRSSAARYVPQPWGEASATQEKHLEAP